MRVRRLKPLMVTMLCTPSVSFEHALDLARHLVRALQRGRVRELHVHEEEALVFVGDEARGQPPPEAAREDGEAGQDDQAQGRLADEAVGEVDVAVGHAREAAVEGAEEAAEQARATRAAAAGAWPTARARG